MSDASAAAAGFGEEADALLERIMPFLAGHDPELQGAVVTDLAALWIAGHRVEGSRAEGDRMRGELLEVYLQHVRELVEMYLEGVDG